MRRIAIVLLAITLAPALWAVEGIPDWSRTLDEVLRRAEAEAASTKPLAPPQPSATQALHPAIEGFLSYYQGAGAKTWNHGVERLQRHRVMFAAAFREQRVPEELLWLGLVESGYRAAARSPKDAVGVWQFIPETARRFGLIVNRKRDERTDTPKATRAAARYLRFLYDTFGDWNLALAAYNAGEGRVRDAIARSQSRDFWTIAARGFLPRETTAYVPAVLAAQALGEGKATPPSERRTVEATFSLSE
ncbi:MAG TPA: lytic transglycosylase domain-containing protein [Bryobacteraceae bacterium]|nr:lytic transglycosylase domain-containing protein [Bryobacteraceae bacterium]